MMRTDPRPGEVRRLVAQGFDDLGVPTYALSDISETVVIDGGRYVARSYRLEGYLAMWLVGVGIVQFYDTEGEMLMTINLFETVQPERLVA